ncbi:dihydroneopterin aldolase [Candidatus Pseudomonas adelgestsugas]|uniref:7,8-dihydroneopterin aldolase n=1 Tax=Candidatus Pseudomonas adelgestsugas TaxID=1302376 RepID=A0ABX5R7N2_9PSED|nr:dihydroneopterin aldolase [Candidatus Pseudomonas adelgestsugas]QAX81484.1 Dihydroneopterin aldolase [Candidatus Pseudomonas adelgestsugas]
MDRLFIEGLEVDTVIGAYDWERSIKQCLRLDLSVAWDNRQAAANDDLALVLDYTSVCTRIQVFAEKSQYQLLETFAEQLAEMLMSEFQIPWLRLKLIKPGVIPTINSVVGVEIERRCR